MEFQTRTSCWKSVCKPSECGGLGLRNLHYWNRALLCKLLWNIHIKKNTLWIKWVNHYYSTDFWNYTGRTEDSTLLKSLIKLRNELSLNDASSETLIQRLQHWFEGSNASVDHAYRWFSRTRCNGRGKRYYANQRSRQGTDLTSWDLYFHTHRRVDG